MAFTGSKYKEFVFKYRTEKVYTRKQMKDALKKQERELKVNRVIQSFTGRYGPTETKAMKILAVHKTPEGILVIVQ